MKRQQSVSHRCTRTRGPLLGALATIAGSLDQTQDHLHRTPAQAQQLDLGTPRHLQVEIWILSVIRRQVSDVALMSNLS